MNEPLTGLEIQAILQHMSVALDNKQTEEQELRETCNKFKTNELNCDMAIQRRLELVQARAWQQGAQYVLKILQTRQLPRL